MAIVLVKTWTVTVFVESNSIVERTEQLRINQVNYENKPHAHMHLYILVYS